MDIFKSMRVSSSGLDAQTKRMNTISSNIANAESPNYKRKDPVFQATADRESFGEILKSAVDEEVQGVQVVEIKEDDRPSRMVFNPSHPHADADGMVAMPNVNPVQEMANMISAQRSYEANVNALNTAVQMGNKALELGR